MVARYEGTRLGRQELDAELLEDVEGALWTRTLIDASRVAKPPPLVRIVVGVDPKASAAADSETDIEPHFKQAHFDVRFAYTWTK